MRSRLLLGALLLAACIGQAAAQTASEILRDFGLLGTWAYDCSQPASDENYYSVYAALENGHVTRTYFDGPNHVYNSYVIERARLRDDGYVWYEQFDRKRNDDFRHMQVIVDRSGDKYRVVYSKNIGGDTLIDDAISLKGEDAGKQKRWSYRCR